MANRERCNTCGWCHRDENKDMICCNDESEYVADYVDETHWCEEYKKKMP